MDKREFFEDIRNGYHKGVSDALVSHPEWVHLRDSRGSTPLILAAYYDQKEIVRLLLDNGADLDSEDASGNTALMGACFKGFGPMAKMLIEAGANVNARNAMGATCLIFAVTFNREEIAKLLIDNNADVTIKDARGNTASEHARMQGLNDLAALMET